MAIKYNGTKVTSIKYNDVSVNEVLRDNNYVWTKPFSYTQGTLPTGVASLICTRSSTHEPTASTGTINDEDEIYYGDQLYWSVTAAQGYTATVTHGSSNKIVVSSNINGVTSSGVTATRITWTATVSLGTGVKNYVYSTNGGTSWSSATTASTIPNIDYGATLTVKANEANEGYEVTSTTATATYSSQSVTVPAASRIKWSLNVTQSNYIASWTYKINSGSAVTKTSSYNITNLDYSDTVVITATNQSEVEWNYGTPSGPGNYRYNGSKTRTLTLSSTRSRKTFSVVFKGTYCTWDSNTLTAEYGDTISTSGIMVTCKCWDDSSLNRWGNACSAYATTAQYSYSTPSISGGSVSSVTEDVEITGASTRTLRSYSITFNNPTYGSWSTNSLTAYYGDAISVSDYTVTCKAGGSSGSPRWTNTCSPFSQTDQYTYSFSGSITITGLGSGATVVGAATVSGPSSSRTERSYGVGFSNGTYGSWDSTNSIVAPYSASITRDGWKITVNGNTRTYTLPSDTTQYDYEGNINGTFPMTVGTGKGITVTTTRTTKSYAVSITAGTGLSEAYLSTSSTATSGNPSGTYYNYGTTVYAFVTLAEHYDIPADSNWVLVYGTKDATGSKYRVGSVSVTGAHNFGTYYAVIEKYNLTISKGTGISTIYYKVNGASSYASSTSSVSVSVNDLSTYYYYATADSYHTANSDCGSSSSPKSGTVNCADISKSVSTTAKTYTLVGNYTNGSVTWYSDSARTTAITSAAYGSTVYYAYSPNTGYSGSGNGSLVLNTSNFTISGSNATHNFGSATRLTWSLSITKSNYMATVTYQKNSEAAVAVTGTTNLTGLDYADTVVVSGTKQSEAPYNYGNITGTGTFTYSASAQSTTVACTRSVKSYTFTLTKNSNVSAIKVWRTESPYQGAATSTESNPMINGTGTATIYYGDKLSGTASASTGYHFGNSNTSTTDSYTNSGVTGNASWSPTVNLNAYTATFTATNCSWTNATRTIYHFDYITTSGQTVTCKAGGSSGSNRWQNTATKGSETGYTFGTPTLSGNTSVSSVTGDIAISASSTKSRTAFTVSFATTDYGTWSNGNSLTAYYGDKVTRSGNTVTCYKWDATSTARWTNTLNPFTNTAQYTYTATASGSGSSSLTDNISFSATSTRTLNSYTITWSYQSAYGIWTTATESYNYGDTPSRSSPGDVTSGTSKQVFIGWDSLAPVTADRTITAQYKQQYYLTFTGTRCTCNKSTGWYDSSSTAFTATWTASANCAFSSDGTTTTATQSITPNQAGTYSKSADYIYVTISNGTGCSANYSTGWHPYGRTVTWTRSSGYAFDSSGTTTATANLTTPGGSYQQNCTHGYYTLSLTNSAYNSGNNQGWYAVGTKPSTTVKANSGWSFGGSTAQDTTTIGGDTAVPCTKSASPSYFYITVSSTRCSANKSSGFYTSSTKPSSITWTADTAYAFDSSNTTTYTNSTIYSYPATYSASADYVKRYALTISVTGSSYGSYGVSRTSSPYQGASTGALSNGATIYYGDVLSGSSSAAGTRYGDWDYNETNFKVATGSWNGGDTTSPSITLTAQNNAPAYLYVWRNDTWTNLVGGENWSNQSGKTNTYTDTGLAFNTTYTYHVAGYKHRSYWTRSADANNYTGTNGVIGNVTATFKFTESSAQTESAWIGGSPSTVEIVTGSRNAYTITWKYRDAYNSWTTTTQSYYWGETPSAPVTPSTVTSGNYRRVPTSWDSLASVTGARTITMGYTDEFYASISGTRCTGSPSSKWSSSAWTCTWTADTNWAFDSSGATTVSQTISDAGSYSKTAGYIYVTISGSHCSADKSTGWNIYGATCTWEREWGYAFDSSGTATTSESLTTPGGSYSKSCTYGYWTVNYTNCTPSDYGGWKLLSGNPYSVTFTANSGYAFDSSGTSTYTVSNVNVPTTTEGVPGYGYFASSNRYCTADTVDGWKPVSSFPITCTWTADSGYYFDSSGTTTSSGTYNPSTLSVNKSANYAYVTLSYTNCNGPSSGIYRFFPSLLADTITISAAAGWSFGGQERDNITQTLTATSYSFSPSYFYVTFTGTRCTSSENNGFKTTAGIVTWTASSNCAFDISGTTTTTTTYPAQPGDYTQSADFIQASSISGTRCTANRSANTWYLYGTIITWTASAPWAFNSTGTSLTTTQGLTTPGGTYDASADYGRRYAIDYYVGDGEKFVQEDSSYRYPDYGSLDGQAEINFGAAKVLTSGEHVARYYNTQTGVWEDALQTVDGSWVTMTRPAVSHSHSSYYMSGDIGFYIELPVTPCGTVLQQSEICDSTCTTNADSVCSTIISQQVVCDNICSTNTDGIVCTMDCTTNTDSACSTAVMQDPPVICNKTCTTDVSVLICDSSCSTSTSSYCACSSLSSRVSIRKVGC